MLYMLLNTHTHNHIYMFQFKRKDLDKCMYLLNPNIERDHLFALFLKITTYVNFKMVKKYKGSTWRSQDRFLQY